MNMHKQLSGGAILLALAFPFGLSGCSREVSHTETTHENLMGGQTHEETTVYRNPDGTVNVDKEKTVTH